MGILVATVLMGLSGQGQARDLPLADLDARFTPTETPVCMEYDVGYRLLNIELRSVAKVVATTTIGTWRHRVSGASIPALFLDMRVDSPDSGLPGQRNRISIHDRLVAVMRVPEMQALVFAKATDESLRPLFHVSESLGVSVYDTQSGQLDYEHRNLKTGSVSTNIANPEALLELSRRIRPVMQFLVAQCKAPTPDAATSENGRVVANLDGKVAALRILTSPAKSPGCFDRKRLESLCIRTVAEKGSAVRPRDFLAWSMPFGSLANYLHDPMLCETASRAPVETVVPLVMDYELALGKVRVTLRALHLGHAAMTAQAKSVRAEGPEPVAQE